MCQTAAYVVEDGAEKLILEDVVSLIPEEGALRLANLFGEEKVIRGRLRRIDLLAHRITIDPPEKP